MNASASISGLRRSSRATFLFTRRCPLPLQPLALACLAALASPLALAQAALPTGAQVVSGQASISTAGNSMTVTNSAGAVLNWQSFSIGAGQSVRFEQLNAQSQVLNRVVGRDPSSIFGHLSSNGGVWLLNPYGVVFGASARVDVGSLVASTLNLSDADWRARRYSLTGGADNSGALLNQGELRSTSGGRVLLVGGSAGVRNEGSLDAPGGQAGLLAGATVDLADSSTPQIAVRVSAAAGEVTNLGRVSAAGGRIDLQGAMVNQQGLVRADSLGSGPGGRVVLQASDTLLLAADSQTSATSTQGPGGRIDLLGPQVGLLDGSRVDVSGRAGGGEVYAGGGLQGSDASLPNARALFMGRTASVRADADDNGNGGRIVLWSDQATRVYGSISARGGARGGDGGFIETSGGWLDARPASVRTDAPRGKAGTWLLDPNDITIGNGEGSFNVTASPNFTSTSDSAFVEAADISAALSGGSSVVVTTGSGGANSQAGDITIEGFTTITSTSSVPVTLTLNASRDIRMFGSSISSDGLAPLNVTFNAGLGGAGTITLTSTPCECLQYSVIDTQGGTVRLGGPSVAPGAPFAGAVGRVGSPTAVFIDEAAINAGSGSVIIAGATTVSSVDTAGVSIGSNATITGRDIQIRGWAGSSGAASQYGVYSNGQILASNSLSIEGTSATAGGGETIRVGVLLDSDSTTAVLPGAGPATSLTLTGSSVTAPGSDAASVAIRSGSLQAGGGAAVQISGTGGDIEFF